MGKWQLGIVGVFLIIYALTVVITGHPSWVLAVLLLALLIAAYAAINWQISRVIVDKEHHGDVGEAEADNEALGLPAAHLIGDDERPAGDTPEAHDEISPHDLPMGHPGRLAAEEQSGGEDGATRGNAQGGAGGASGGGASDDTAQRTGEEQRSAAEAK